MRPSKTAVAEELRRAAERQINRLARRDSGMCESIKPNPNQITPAQHEAVRAMYRIFASDAVLAGPSTSYWGANWGAHDGYCKYSVIGRDLDFKRAKDCRVLALLFAAEYVDQHGVPIFPLY